MSVKHTPVLIPATLPFPIDAQLRYGLFEFIWLDRKSHECKKSGQTTPQAAVLWIIYVRPMINGWQQDFGPKRFCSLALQCSVRSENSETR